MLLTKKMSQVKLRRTKEGVTGKMGLSWIGHCMEHFGLEEMVNEVYGDKKKSNREINAYEKIMAGAMTRIAGGDRIEDIETLRADKGFVDSLGWEQIAGADAYTNFINNKRNNEKNRIVNEMMAVKSMRKSEEEEFTYDNDATYSNSNKNSAAYSYQGKRQHSGLIGCIAELGVINTEDFRRGNISPQTGIYEQLEKAIRQTKTAGKKIKRYRSDSASHQNKIFRLCNEENIEYYISLDKNGAVKKCIGTIKKEEWKPLSGRYQKRLGTEWAETVYVTEKGISMRTLILRWANPDPDLFDDSLFCYHAIGTNNNKINAMKWLEIHNGRMGTIEHINKEIKAGLGCDYAPSHEFEKNRGYFLMGIIAHNIAQIMKLFYLRGSAKHWTLKRMRYQFVNVCGKIIKTGRQFYCNITNVTKETFELFRNCKSQLIMMC